MPLIQSLKYQAYLDSLEEHKATHGKTNTFWLLFTISSDTLQSQEGDMAYIKKIRSTMFVNTCFDR